MTDTPPREFTGRDLVEALQEAARSFGVRRSELGYELIENYGVGARGCVIRAWPRAGAVPRGGGAPRADFDRAPRPERGGGYGDRPDRSQGDRPDRSHGDRPDRSQGDRPDRGQGDRPDRGQGVRPGGGRSEFRGSGGPPRRPEDRDRPQRERAGGPRRGGFEPRGGGAPRHDLPESARRQAPPERSRGGMYDDALPARLSDRPAGQRDERPRRGGFRRPDGRPDGRRDGGRDGARGGDAAGARRPERRDQPPPRDQQGRGGRRGDGRRPEGGPREDWGQRGGQARRPPGAADAQGGGPREERNPRRGRRRGRPEGDRPDHPVHDRRHEQHDGARREPTVPATEAHAVEVRDLLEEIIDRWGMELQATSKVYDDTVYLSLDGPDAHRLAANDGELLDSVQYLISKMTSRLLTDNVRVLLDAADFRASRDQALRDRATARAHEALDSGKKLRLDPLNPYERRVVHLALKEIPGIRTYSIGRSYLKRVTIEPVSDEPVGGSEDE